MDQRASSDILRRGSLPELVGGEVPPLGYAPVFGAISGAKPDMGLPVQKAAWLPLKRQIKVAAELGHLGGSVG